MSTLEHTECPAPVAVPATVQLDDAATRMAAEQVVTSGALESAPRPPEYDAAGVRALEFDGTGYASAPDAKAAAKRRNKLKKMLYTVAAASLTAGAVLVGAMGLRPAPEPAPVPRPVVTASSIRQILSDHSNWYSAEYDVYLHFNEGVGWLYDHGDFHRLLWTIQDEGSESEKLVIETGYAYLETADGGWKSNEFTSELQVAAEGDSFTISGVAGIAFHDDASTAFVPVDTIDVNSTYVDRFGAMTGQQILEAIGTFVLHDSSITDSLRYESLAFAGGAVTIDSEWMTPVTIHATYLERLNGHIYTDEAMVYPVEGGEPFEPGRIPGTMIIREDNVYFYLHGLHSRLEFVPSSIPEGIEPQPVVPPAAWETVIFGHYEQDANLGNGPEPITWRVLAVEGDRTLLVAVNALDCRPYSAWGEGNAWESSDLRAWLHGAFMETAFTEEERAQVVEATCLSMEEAAGLFTGDADRQCKPTAYALAQGVWTHEGNCEWWLRTPSPRILDHAVYVAPDGSIFEEGIRVGSDTFAVRPAIWVKQPAHGDCPTPSTVVGATGSKISHSFSASPHPRGEGNTVLVSVYNDEWYQNGDFWGNRLIGDFYKIPEEEFVALTLPEAPAPLGQYGEGVTFEPIGYILYYGPLQVTEDTYGTFYWAEDTEFAIMLYGNQLTWDEVQFIPPDEYGVRYVNIHVVYARTSGDGAILADDGLGNVTAYDTAQSPFQSAGVTWLATLPVPEMPCYEFAGWFDKDGNQVWYVWNEDVYEYIYDWESDNPDDWTTEVIVHPAEIVAGWVEAQ